MAIYRTMSLEAPKKNFYVKIGYILYMKKFSDQYSHTEAMFT